LTPKESGREGVYFLLGDNELFLQALDIDTIDRSAKIVKKDSGN